MFAAIDEPILRLGAVAGALIAIGGCLTMFVRWGVRQFVGAVRTEMGHVTPKLDRVVENTMELKPNGGSTVADAVRRLEAMQLNIAKEQGRQADQLRRHEEHQNDLRRILVEHLADHSAIKPKP